MKVLNNLLLLLFSFCLITCSGIGVPDSQSLNARIFGIWKVESGRFLDGLYPDTLKYIQLNRDGTAQVIYQDETNTLTCTDLIYAVINTSTVAFSIPQRSTYEYKYQKEGTTLVLSDALSNDLSLSSQDEIPSASQCKNLTIDNKYSDLTIEPSYWTNLVWDGTYLWFEEDYTQKIYPFDPTAETLGVPVDLSTGAGYTHPQAFQGTDFWFHCACSTPNEASRRNSSAMGVEIDGIDTADFGANETIEFDAMTWDGSHLWVLGYHRASGMLKFLKIDSDSEPDLSAGSAVFDLDLRALTWDGENIWGIRGEGSSGKVIKINPDIDDLKTLETYKISQDMVSWYGIAAVEGSLYILGRDEETNKAVIYKTTP